MVETLKDSEDRRLESMLSMTPLADDGFSASVVKRVTRKIWLRRLTLPGAAIIGATVAAKPLTGLIATTNGLIERLPKELLIDASTAIPQFQTILMGAVLFAVCTIGMRIISE